MTDTEILAGYEARADKTGRPEWTEHGNLWSVRGPSGSGLDCVSFHLAQWHRGAWAYIHELRNHEALCLFRDRVLRWLREQDIYLVPCIQGNQLRHKYAAYKDSPDGTTCICKPTEGLDAANFATIDAIQWATVIEEIKGPCP